MTAVKCRDHWKALVSIAVGLHEEARRRSQDARAEYDWISGFADVVIADMVQANELPNVKRVIAHQTSEYMELQETLEMKKRTYNNLRRVWGVLESKMEKAVRAQKAVEWDKRRLERFYGHGDSLGCHCTSWLTCACPDGGALAGHDEDDWNLS